jgi:hypothetical protein
MSKAEWDGRYVDETLEVGVAGLGSPKAAVGDASASDEIDTHGDLW